MIAEQPERRRRARAALALADCLEATRDDEGYGGPVVHWWRDCLVDCRASHDWRYEGVVAGYLALHAASGDDAWLSRARRAGDDLVRAQRPDGHFARSRFELNPGPGGTPHEAAAATALLRLALTLRAVDRAAAERYLAAARTGLERGLIDRLWDPAARAFRDDPAQPSLVPNKACTAVEALLLLAEATGDDRPVVAHAVPTADAVLALQVRRPGHRLDGAIAQNSAFGRVVAKYFPYYVARCIPGLLALHRHGGDGRYAEAALAAGRFLLRCRDEDGGWPQVLYEDGRVGRYPRWVAAVGDTLLALESLRALGLDADLGPTRRWLLDGLLPSGGIRTARGFAGQARPTLPPGPDDFRDGVVVAGWADKALRWLASGLTGPDLAAAARDPLVPTPFEAEVSFQARRLSMRAEGPAVELRERGATVYRWRPGRGWPDVVSPWLVAR